ncbi:uncharacterized protein Gasu_00920 [Galdieria sulphuraria]|uniref:Uncharacterized protein n=1 Tax=Galdieria sulphuraria TaxID=130081 RepID=M2XR45_GALSU|nr:uncharacterized protein Gasu_00920 [Galdieria sulphuraria]EME32727.1 hypothetical protein Gasu_00920 [Galdieria sulphuraria]|eukprot:XP_005709247.1 hypothetical protein Gasu_00920 [Galdieria sulphuraria]
MSFYPDSVVASLDAVEEFSDGQMTWKFGSSVPFSVREVSSNSFSGKEKMGGYLSQSLKPDIFRRDSKRLPGYSAEGLTGSRSVTKPPLSKLSILSTGGVTEGEITFTSSSHSESQTSVHGFGEIEEQEVFEFSSRNHVARESQLCSIKNGRGRSPSTNNFEIPRENSSERDEEDEENNFVPPHLLVQRETQSLFERPCSKRMINWT